MGFRLIKLNNSIIITYLWDSAAVVCFTQRCPKFKFDGQKKTPDPKFPVLTDFLLKMKFCLPRCISQKNNSMNIIRINR